MSRWSLKSALECQVMVICFLSQWSPNKLLGEPKNTPRSPNKRWVKYRNNFHIWKIRATHHQAYHPTLHFDKLQINIISEDRSQNSDQNCLEIIKIRQNLTRFWSVQSFKIQESLHHPKRCAMRFSIEWWDPRLKQTSFW